MIHRCRSFLLKQGPQERYVSKCGTCLTLKGWNSLTRKCSSLQFICCIRQNRECRCPMKCPRKWWWQLILMDFLDKYRISSKSMWWQGSKWIVDLDNSSNSLKFSNRLFSRKCRHLHLNLSLIWVFLFRRLNHKDTKEVLHSSTSLYLIKVQFCKLSHKVHSKCNSIKICHHLNSNRIVHKCQAS
jgi:hypothetical protein